MPKVIRLLLIAFVLLSVGCRQAQQSKPTASYTLEQLTEELQKRVGDKKTNGQPDAGLAALSTDQLIDELRARMQAVYGNDDRLDYFEASAPLKQISESVASLWKKDDLGPVINGASSLRTTPLSMRPGFCGGTLLVCNMESFRTQPVGAFCTGFIVAENLIATAGHCVRPTDGPVTDIRVVFGFRMNGGAAGDAVTQIPSKDIYSGVEVFHRTEQSSGPDWALVRVDRNIANRVRLPLRLLGKISDNQPVTVVGYPSGLPLKVASGAAVRSNSASSYFVANLDTFGGNSGSPVFSEAGGVYRVEGILVRGETDYQSNGSCCRVLVCPNTGCRGEDVTRTTEFAQYVPAP